MISLSAVAICVLSLIVIAGLAYVAAQWLYKKDTEVENRRKAAGKLAVELSKVGFVKLPEFLINYSVGDYSSMLHQMKNITELATGDPAAFMREFESVFNRLLDSKLSTEDGRVLIAAKLQQMAADTDPDVVHDAPHAVVE